MAARNVLFALAAVLLLGAVLAAPHKGGKPKPKVGASLDLASRRSPLSKGSGPKNSGPPNGPHGLQLDVVRTQSARGPKRPGLPKGPGPHAVHLDVQPHHLQKRFFGLHVHKRPKVYLVNPAPPQVVYIKKHRHHHAFHAVVQPRLSVHLGHRHHHHRHHARFNVHLGLGH